MAGEKMVPLLPCPSIDEIEEFYGMLGFERTYRQTRPNPYVAVRREGIELHFFGMDGFEPENSYGSCIVSVPDTGALYRAFADGFRAARGKLPVAGIPRMTRPRKRKNADGASGFSVIDPGGNWIRFFAQAEPRQEPASKLGRVLENAIVLGESKGDARQAARILDASLAKAESSVVDRVNALVYRAELAVVLGEAERAGELLARVEKMPLEDEERPQVADALENARELRLAM